ncbi:uracil-DNA glycosylase [Telmatospirillum sp. J64-1]|uniref:uracil-DNA glycosylase n=1 Tax=Telmatospirillum sp. J64-1 TaxID=2502183 RepID=UPI00115DFE51|nr:uracil-DNA glycosylase [Telmatospirillum sp. J64-1]
MHLPSSQAAAPSLPGRDCPRCPRLVAFREAQRQAHPDWHNAPVSPFGPLSARVLIVGLAPGLRGANCTGRPFTGDYAGDLLYDTLVDFGFAEGRYERRPDDGLRLTDCRITNAVRCVPPENKPVGAEIKSCRDFLVEEIAAMPNLAAILALGSISHNSVVATLKGRQADFPFAHGARHVLPGGLLLADSYHCSRYNTNTGRLTPEMFRSVFAALRRELG